MAGPSRYNRKLKRKNDRRSARASRGGRTRSEAGLARSTAASGRRVSRTNRAAGRPIRSLPKAGRSPVRIDRAATRRKARLKPRSTLPLKPLDDAARLLSGAGEALGRLVDEDAKRSARIAKNPRTNAAERVIATTPVSPGGALRGPATAISGTARGGVKQVLQRTGIASTTVKAVSKKAAKSDSVSARAAAKAYRAAKKAKKDPRSLREQASGAAKKTKKKAKRTKKKAQTPEGRKQLAKGTAKATARGAGRAASGAAKATARSKSPPAAIGVVAANDLTGGKNDVTRILSNDVKGTVDAVVDDPGKTALTTARVVPGAIAGLAKGAAAVGETAYRGVRRGIAESPDPLAKTLGRDYSGEEIASPVVDTAVESFEGTKQMAKPFVEGDREAVKKTVQEDLGLAPIVFTPRIAKAIRRSKSYQGARGVGRDAAAARREKRRKNLRKQKKREEKTTGQSDVIVPPKPRTDTRSRRGDEYIFQSLGRRVENRRTGRREKMAGERNLRPVDREVSYLVKELGTTIAKVGGDRDKVAAAVALASSQPITRGKTAQSLAYLKNRVLPRQRGTGRDSQPGANYDRQTIEFIEKNQDLTLNNPRFWDAVDLQVAIARAGTTRAKGRGAGQRARYEPAADAYGIKTPKKRMKEGVIVEGRVVRAKPLKPDQIERRLAKAKDLAVKVRKLNRKIEALPEDSPNLAKLVARRDKAQRQGDKLRKEVKDNRLAYAAAEKKFVGMTRTAIERDGLDPDNIGYLREAERIGPNQMGKAGIDSFFRGNVIADQERLGTLRRENRADLSLDTTIRETVLRPRMMEAVNAYTRQFVSQYAVPIVTKRRGKTIYGTAKEWDRAFRNGDIPAGTVLVHSQFFKGSFRGRKAGQDERVMESIFNEDGTPRVTSVAEARKLIGDRAADKKHKYIAVDGKAWDEFMYQIGGPRGSLVRGLSRANRLTSTAILGYNPSWAAAQILAEGLPALASIGLSPGAWRQIFKAGSAYKKESPEVRGQIDAVAGQSGGTLRAFGNLRGAGNMPDYSLTPGFFKRQADKKLPGRRPNSADMDDVVAGFSQRAYRELKDLAKGRSLNEFVLWFGGKYRRGVMNAEIYRRQQKGLTSLARATLQMRKIDKKLNSMDPAEAQRYFAKNPNQAAKLADYMDDVMGNWTALSKTEGALAPWVAFYPYLRYSIRWTFYGFPSRHPIKAQILYWLAQQNANELEEMLGGKPGDWLEYAFPVVTVDGEKERVKGARRFQPALSVLVEALGVDEPQRLLGGLNPALGAARQAIEGDTAFSADPVAFGFQDRLLLGLSAFASMLAPIRWSDQLVEGGTINRITPRRDYSKGPFSKESVVGGERSKTAQKFRNADPGAQINNPLDLLRSSASLNILRRQSARDARRETRLKRQLSGGTTSSSGGSSSSSSPSSSSGWWGSGSSSKNNNSSSSSSGWWGSK